MKVKGEVHSEGEGECTRVHGYSAVVKGNGKVQIVECNGTAAIFTVGSFEGETISLAPGALVQVCTLFRVSATDLLTSLSGVFHCWGVQVASTQA